MRKLLLLAAGALLATSASATQWAVVGAYSDPAWNFEASTVFTGEGDELSCTIDYLTNDFKIVDIDVNDWSVQYGTSTPLEIGVKYELQGKNGGNDPANIKFAGLIQGVKNAQVNWNPSTYTLEITANENDVVMGYPTLYVTGSFCNWNEPGTGESVLMSQENGIYTATVNLGTSGKVEFKLAGSGWSNEIAGGVTVTDEKAVEVTKGGDNLLTSLTGEQTLTFNYNTMSMTFGDPSLTDMPEAPVRVWAVVGSYSNPTWNFDASTILEGEGDNLSCTIDYLFGEFKIVDIANNNWSVQYGTDTPIEVNTPYILDGVNGNDEPSNISFAGLIQGVKNAKVCWNPSTCTLEIIAEESDVIIAYPTLYVTGSYCSWATPGSPESTEMTEANGVYTAEVDLGNSAELVEFKLVGLNWLNQIGGGVVVSYQPVQVSKSEENLKTYLKGVQTVVFDYNSMTMFFDEESGVNNIESMNNADVEYYNLQGVKVNNPSNGIFIIKQGNKTSKAVIR